MARRHADPKWERYFLDELIPLMTRRLRVVARVGRRRIGASRKRRIRINLTRVSGHPARVVLRVTGTRAGRKVRVKRVRRVRTWLSRTSRGTNRGTKLSASHVTSAN